MRPARSRSSSKLAFGKQARRPRSLQVGRRLALPEINSALESCNRAAPCCV
jgi:hypothetical protein